MALSFILFLLFSIDEKQEILMESLESKTIDGQAIFNKIRYRENEVEEVWTMNQSHYGLRAKKNEWDKLEIVIDKTVTPHRATFHQYKLDKEVEYRVSCSSCHANGPRMIRARSDSLKAPLSWSKLLGIALWNKKIKLSPPILQQETTLNGHKRMIPLDADIPNKNEELKVKTCRYCHNNGESFMPIHRFPLTKRQKGTIYFLVNNNLMPPFPFKLSAEERKELKQFLFD